MLYFIAWSLLGGAAGWHFGLRTEPDFKREVRRNIVVGVVGGIVGGLLFHWSSTPRLSSAESVLTAFVGAISLLGVLNWFPQLVTLFERPARSCDAQ